MKGRKNAPAGRAQILGFPGKRKPRAGVPQASFAPPEAPHWLNARAREVFAILAERLSGQKLASNSHTEMLSLAASRIEEIERLQAFINESGETYESVNTSGGIMFRARPEVAMRNEAMRHAHALLAEFGLSPSAMNKVSARDSGEEDPLAKYGS